MRVAVLGSALLSNGCTTVLPHTAPQIAVLRSAFPSEVSAIAEIQKHRNFDTPGTIDELGLHLKTGANDLVSEDGNDSVWCISQDVICPSIEFFVSWADIGYIEYLRTEWGFTDYHIALYVVGPKERLAGVLDRRDAKNPVVKNFWFSVNPLVWVVFQVDEADMLRLVAAFALLSPNLSEKPLREVEGTVGKYKAGGRYER